MTIIAELQKADCVKFFATKRKDAVLEKLRLFPMVWEKKISWKI